MSHFALPLSAYLCKHSYHLQGKGLLALQNSFLFTSILCDMQKEATARAL